VTSVILSPGQSLSYLEKVVARIPNVSVMGIAGPGDPMANPVETLETLSLVRKRYPGMLLCLATNGLALPQYVDQLARLKVSHVTVTVNAVDADIGAYIYAWVRDGKRILRGREAAEFLLSRQIEGIKLLKSHGITVKINFILIPGINEGHVVEVAKSVSSLGADIFNCMPLIPSAGSIFSGFSKPPKEMVAQTRAIAAEHIAQMKHCERCRADAVGLIGQGMDEETLNDLKVCSRLPLNPLDNRLFVAVATMEGVLVNQHLGRADEFQIFERTSSGFDLKEIRKAPTAGSGDERWTALADLFQDCRSVLVSAAGMKPVYFLKKAGIEVVEMDGLIEQGLDYVYNGTPFPGRRVVKEGCSCGQGSQAPSLSGAQPVSSCGKGCSSSGGCGGNGLGCV
jgi:nitrogen fixation protein NifB